MPRKSMPSRAKKQIMSVSLPLPLIDRLTENTSNRSEFVQEAIEAKLDYKDRPSVGKLIRFLTTELEQITSNNDLSATYNINPANLDDLHQVLSDLYRLMHPNGEE